MTRARPASVGLGGDGDEITAIGDVEAAFGVVLDHVEAGTWETAGDVYAALGRALGKTGIAEPPAWPRFADVLSRQTGVDPLAIGPESPLISDIGLWPELKYGTGAIRSLVLILAVGGLLLAWFLRSA